MALQLQTLGAQLENDGRLTERPLGDRSGILTASVSDQSVASQTDPPLIVALMTIQPSVLPVARLSVELSLESGRG